MASVRPCRESERGKILTIINAAAEVYRGVIPADQWHEPYMSPPELDREIAAGVRFTGYATDATLLGVMGIQRVQAVDLIRHSYVIPASQGQGVGGALLDGLVRCNERPVLVGTWAAASWAIQFYERHGFELVSPRAAAKLMAAYWSIPAGQRAVSVVLRYSRPPQPRPTNRCLAT
jgi:GNAT superfamily N-acetyltransferase